MSKKPLLDFFDSIDYCINFWDGALDPEDEIDHFLGETAYPAHSPRHVRASDDLA